MFLLLSATVPNIPLVVNSIPDITVDLGHKFEFKVPNDTFYDYQDGWTSNLELRLLSAQGQVSIWPRTIVLPQYVLCL